MCYADTEMLPESNQISVICRRISNYSTPLLCELTKVSVVFLSDKAFRNPGWCIRFTLKLRLSKPNYLQLPRCIPRDWTDYSIQF
ncbi:protein of unknown function [Cyanobium sp. NIES-981]|nr:protein of unknown function [Cyanobium sp. NIES-981]